MKEKILAELFKKAIETKNPDKVEQAISAVFSADYPEDFENYLINILNENWHFRHEDVVNLLQKIASPDSVNHLLIATNKKYDYLNYDNSISFARKCIWALADIGNDEAKEALLELSENSDSAIAEYAQKRIDNWFNEIERKKHYNSFL